MAQAQGSGPTEWRLHGPVLAVRLLPVLGCLAVGGWALGRSAEWAYTALTVESTALATLLTFLTLRARVRLRHQGVEVRELLTRRYAWAEISWVEPSILHTAVRLGFADGSARTLPAPKALRGTPAEIDQAVAAVQRGAGDGE